MSIKSRYIYSALSLIAVTSFIFLLPSSAIAATFGYVGDNGSVQTNSTQRKYLSCATAGTSGTLTGGAVRMWVTTSGSWDSVMVVYASDGGSGAPGTLLAISDQQTFSNTSEAEHTYVFSGANQISIVGGTSYCMGEHHTDPGANNLNYSRQNTANQVYSDPDVFSDGPANPCACATLSNGPLDVYLTYTEAAAGTPGSVAQFRTGATFRTGAVFK